VVIREAVAILTRIATASLFLPGIFRLYDKTGINYPAASSMVSNGDF